MTYRKIGASNTNHGIVVNLGLFPTNFFFNPVPAIKQKNGSLGHKITS